MYSRKFLRRKNIMTMAEFWAKFDEFFTKLWNWLYELVCADEKKEPNDDFYVDTMFPEEK